MRLVNTIATTAQAVFLTVLISIPWGGIIGTLMSLLNDDPATKWYHLAAGGALLAPILAIVFESPIQRVVMLLAKLPYMWIVVLPFALLRFVFSVIPAMIAVRIISAPARSPAAVPCPFEGIIRAIQPVEIAGKAYDSNDVVFEILNDWSVKQDNQTWGRVNADGFLRPNSAASPADVSAARIHDRRLLINDRDVGVLNPK